MAFPDPGRERDPLLDRIRGLTHLVDETGLLGQIERAHLVRLNGSIGSDRTGRSGRIGEGAQ